MDVRCEALTLAGTRCKHRGKHKDQSGQHVCQQHLYGIHRIISVKDIEPWVQREMPTPALDLLRPHVVQKLRRKLKAGPRAATPRGLGKGRGGSIYVYCLEADDHSNLYKIGMTSDSVDKRLQQWARKHKTELRRVAEYVVSQDVAWVERVVHLYLDYCRVYRYPLANGTGLHSVWAATGEPLDADAAKPPSPRSMLATEKMIEWFQLPFDEIDATISQVH
jgi:hypothetical protein